MKKLVITSVLAVLVAAGNAGAITFSGNTVGSWTAPVKESSGAYVDIAGSDVNGNAVVTWGDPASKWLSDPKGVVKTRSFLSFDGAGSDGDNDPAQWSSVSVPFSVGNLDFHNGVIESGSGINNVDLNLAVTILSPNLGALSTFTYDMGIQNTVNPAGDKVIILNSPASVLFTYGGWEYTFGLLGFSADGQSFSSQLFATEECSVSTKIWGTMTGRELPNNVPDGGSTLILVGMALTGLGFLRSKIA